MVTMQFDYDTGVLKIDGRAACWPSLRLPVINGLLPPAGKWSTLATAPRRTTIRSEIGCTLSGRKVSSVEFTFSGNAMQQLRLAFPAGAVDDGRPTPAALPRDIVKRLKTGVTGDNMIGDLVLDTLYGQIAFRFDLNINTTVMLVAYHRSARPRRPPDGAAGCAGRLPTAATVV